MARPQKEGLDYFPLNCQFSDSVKLLQVEFGPVGVGVLISLWQKIYGGKGYYTPWDNDVTLMFAKEIGAGVNVVREIVSACLRRGIFDSEKFEKFSILTSKGVQERYAEATERRISQKIDARYLLVSAPSNWVIVDNNSINVDNNAVNVDKSTQSKVKESKVNKSIVEDKDTSDFVLTFCDGSLPIASAQITEYSKRYPLVNVMNEFEKMQVYLSGTNHKKMLSDSSRFIRGWLKGENEKAKNKLPEKPLDKSHDANDFFRAAIKKSMGENFNA